MSRPKNDFVSAKVVLGADVADAGTFTVSYPAGYTAGDFSNAQGHYLSLNGDKLLQPQHIMLSFGASAVTVTNNTGSTLPEGSKGYFQFELRGESVNKLGTTGTNRVQRIRANEMFELFVDFGSPAAADADGILNDQSATDSATSYTSADFVSTFDGTLDVPRNLTATGTAGSNHVITVTGEDEYGEAISENITLNGTNTVAGAKAFYKVTTVSVAAGAAGDTFDLGWGDVLGLPVAVRAYDELVKEYEAGVDTGKINGDVYVPFEIDATKYAAGTSEWLVSPINGTIEEVVTVVNAATTGAGAISVELATVAVAGLSVVVAGSSSVGDIDFDTPSTPGSSTTVVDAGESIEIVSDGTPTGGSVRGHVRIRPRADNGALVLALDENTKSTATTADVRGTYDPTTACDGTTSFALVLRTAQPADVGNIQYSA